MDTIRNRQIARKARISCPASQNGVSSMKFVKNQQFREKLVPTDIEFYG
jgi:hypothetical protein